MVRPVDIIREHSRMLIQLGRLAALKAIKHSSMPNQRSPVIISFTRSLVRKEPDIEMRQTVITILRTSRIDPNHVDNGHERAQYQESAGSDEGETGSIGALRRSTN